MREPFVEMLAADGKKNSLGRAPEVVTVVLADQSRLPELYDCLFAPDAWVRMRGADALEKVCREHPDWLVPYIGRMQTDLASSTQPSILWHMAQIYAQVPLSNAQKTAAIQWLKRQVATNEVDWIVAANTLETLVQFAKDGSVPKAEVKELLKVQQHHKSNAVVRRATKLLDTF